ncbi:Orexin receptor type 2 [Orchesella cincta]|uniref:Orexin receptor type 2 n=1 Tax=Orchesella cincta TaxID=48709 RepID=A0A1D2N547_ORCCI|nr:Orexin receptor type 2 [Orchesella cincta]
MDLDENSSEKIMTLGKSEASSSISSPSVRLPSEGTFASNENYDLTDDKVEKDLLVPTMNSTSWLLYTNMTDMDMSDYGVAEEFPYYIRITSTLLCGFILLIGIIGNILVPVVVWRNKDLRSSTNIFLINLSLADLLILLVCMPPVLIELHSKPEVWVLGAAMCKSIYFFNTFRLKIIFYIKEYPCVKCMFIDRTTKERLFEEIIKCIFLFSNCTLESPNLPVQAADTLQLFIEASDLM